MTKRRNVVLVTIDSLRADHCGFMGYDQNTTPTLDRLAEEGFVFENAIAPGPSTYDSMPAVFTGRHMAPHTAGADFEGDRLDQWSKNIEMNMHTQTIPEWFHDRGYSTAAFTTNPYTGTHSEFARGFDYFEDFLNGGEGALMQKAAHVPVLSELKHLVTLIRGDRASKTWTDYYEEIIDWARDSTEPYFLWIFLLDTHTPYLVSDEFRSTTGRLGMYYYNWKLWFSKKWMESLQESMNDVTLKSMYDDTIRSVDTFIDRLQEDLEESDPALVLHADHGEAFGEHGIYGHKDYLYEENIHIPLVVHDGCHKGTESKPVSLKQLPMILQEVTAGSPHDDQGLDIDPSPPVVTKTWDDSRIALRGTDWKYIATFDPGGEFIKTDVVYNLNTNPEEDLKKADERKQVAEACRAYLRCYLSHRSERENIVCNAEVAAGSVEDSDQKQLENSLPQNEL